MKTLATLCCLTMLTATLALCQEADAPSDENLSFQEIQELLDRFSDTTMQNIEHQLRRKLDEYERSLDEARRAEEGRRAGAAQPTYRLVFRVSDITARMSVLSATGDYSLNAEQETVENGERTSLSHTYRLLSKGEVEPVEPGRVYITFGGAASLDTIENSEGRSMHRASSVNFSGSAHLGLGDEQEIAQNDDLSVWLRIEPVEVEGVAERPTRR